MSEPAKRDANDVGRELGPEGLRAETERLAAAAPNLASGACTIARTPRQLFEYDVAADPNTLLGSRWLCRGGSCLVVGQTGLGKSSFSVQAAVTWALGESLFGIAPVRPLKSLIIQAENDLGDLAEMFKGVVRGTDHAERLDELEAQMLFVTDAAHCGDSFHPWARGLILEHKPDLVWIDPLFSYLGGNVSEQETVSAFLRNGLGVVAQETGVKGCLSLFGRDPEAHRLLAEHLTAEYRVRTEGRGRVVDEWKLRPEAQENHWLDGVVGCAVAASVLGAVLPGTDQRAGAVKARVRLSALQRSR